MKLKVVQLHATHGSKWKDPNTSGASPGSLVTFNDGRDGCSIEPGEGPAGESGYWLMPAKNKDGTFVRDRRAVFVPSTDVSSVVCMQVKDGA